MMSDEKLAAGHMITGYRGRLCAAGITEEGFLFAGQAVSARSEINRQRKAVISGSRVFIRHLNPSQAGNLDLVQYNAIITVIGFAVSANGRHSDELAENFKDINVLGGILHSWGYEPDKTPRIACLLDAAAKKAWFGIVLCDNGTKTFGQQVDLKKGKMHYITTYTGRGKDIELPVRLAIESADSSSEKGITDYLYGLMDPQYAVCASTAVLKGKWSLAVKNHD